MTGGLPLLLGVRQACRLADPPIGRDRGYELVRTGAWKSIRLGRRVLVIASSVVEWADRSAQANGDVTGLKHFPSEGG